MFENFKPLLIIIIIAAAIALSIFLFLYKPKKSTNKTHNKSLSLTTVNIITSKLDMASERTSNHVLAESTVSIYDKLDDGSKAFDSFIETHNYNIEKICRRVH